MTEFKSKKEMIQAMLNGKTIIFDNGSTAYYDKYTYSPFMYKNRQSGVCEGLGSAFEGWKGATTEKEWYEKLDGMGILCWVSDESADEKKLAIKIVKHIFGIETTPFKDIRDSWWEYATPVEPEDLG